MSKKKAVASSKAASSKKPAKKATPKPKAASRSATRSVKASSSPPEVVTVTRTEVQLFPIASFLDLMQGAWNLGRSYGNSIGADEFGRHMRTVLETGSDASLPDRIRSYGREYIARLQGIRNLVGTNLSVASEANQDANQAPAAPSSPPGMNASNEELAS